MITTKTNKDLKTVLMDQAKGLSKATAYYEIYDNGKTIFVLPAGQKGAEYNKTLGYFSNFPGMQTYISLYGSGLFLMQRNDETGEVKEFKVVFLSPLKQISVPAGWAMCLVNTGSTYLVVLRSSPLPDKFINSRPIIEKSGLSYFVIEKKGEIAFERNLKYRVHPQITTE